jgi:hypothetical protein
VLRYAVEARSMGPVVDSAVHPLDLLCSRIERVL